MKKQNLVELFIYSKKMKTKDGKKSFRTYGTRYNFLKEDGTRESKYVAVKFSQNAFASSDIKLSDIKRGKLIVNADMIGCPDRYVITKDENGKDIYPTCWIRDNGVKSYVEVLKEHEFHFDVEEEVETEEQELE